MKTVEIQELSEHFQLRAAQRITQPLDEVVEKLFKLGRQYPLGKNLVAYFLGKKEDPDIGNVALIASNDGVLVSIYKTSSPKRFKKHILKRRG